MEIINRTLKNGELPLFQNYDKSTVYLFNPQQSIESIPSTAEQFFIPTYRIEKFIVDKWITDNNRTLPGCHFFAVCLTVEDAGEFPHFGACYWFKDTAKIKVPF